MLTVAHASDAQVGCGESFSVFRACINGNSCDCNVVGVPSNFFKEGFCGAATSSVCDANGCSNQCDLEYQDYEDCAKELVATLTFQQCQIQCNTSEETPASCPVFELAGGDGDFEECLQLLVPVAGCVAMNAGNCADCAVLNPPVQPFKLELCDIITQTVCGIADCCEEAMSGSSQCVWRMHSRFLANKCNRRLSY
jgi:hypothetical protein